MGGSSLARSFARVEDSIFCARSGWARILLNCACVGNPDAKDSAQAALAEKRARDGFAILLVSMLAVLVLGPVMKGPLGHFLIDAYFTVVLLSALFSLREERLLFRLGLLTGAPAILTMWMGEESAGTGARFAAASALTAVFLGVMSVGLVRRAIAPGRVTMSRILASLCAYLMIGLVVGRGVRRAGRRLSGRLQRPTGLGRSWMVADLVNEDGLLQLRDSQRRSGTATSRRRTEAARSLAVTEAIVGQLYLTVMVARLVGLYVGSRAQLRNGRLRMVQGQQYPQAALVVGAPLVDPLDRGLRGRSRWARGPGRPSKRR